MTQVVCLNCLTLVTKLNVTWPLVGRLMGMLSPPDDDSGSHPDLPFGFGVGGGGGVGATYETVDAGGDGVRAGGVTDEVLTEIGALYPEMASSAMEALRLGGADPEGTPVLDCQTVGVY